MIHSMSEMEPNGQMETTMSDRFSHSTFALVSKVAYLIGVSQRIFDNEHEPPQKDIYYQLDSDKNARIIRNLCRLRTAIERNYGAINERMALHYKTLRSMPDLLPLECIDGLSQDGIAIIRANHTLNQHIIEINRHISDRINNCKNLFPIWIQWEYIRNLFIMPDGLNEAGIKAAANTYYGNMSFYPYQVYMNWPPSDEGNILYNDKKFATLLYMWNEDRFTDYSKVSDAGNQVKGGIYDFIRQSKRTVLAVDCENSDPYKLCATLKNLDAEVSRQITKIMLFDDVHSATAWRILENYTDVPVEHILIERIKHNKSLVDIRLTAGTCREFYQNDVDSFIIVSSDSDYWGLISAIPEARFLVMVERKKCSPTIKEAMERSGIFYCYIDDFYSGDSNDIKLRALLDEVNRRLSQAIHLNVNAMMDAVLQATRADMSDGEKAQFYQKYIKSMGLVIGEDGKVSIELNKK